MVSAMAAEKKRNKRSDKDDGCAIQIIGAETAGNDGGVL